MAESRNHQYWLTIIVRFLCQQMTAFLNTSLSQKGNNASIQDSNNSDIPYWKGRWGDADQENQDANTISLLFHLGKVTEKIMAQHLRSALPPLTNQFGYTLSLGRTDAVIKFTDVINKLDNKNTLGVSALLLDFSKPLTKCTQTSLLRKCNHQTHS